MKSQPFAARILTDCGKSIAIITLCMFAGAVCCANMLQVKAHLTMHEIIMIFSVTGIAQITIALHEHLSRLARAYWRYQRRLRWRRRRTLTGEETC